MFNLLYLKPMSILIRRLKDSDYPAIAEFFDDLDVVAQTSQIPYVTQEHWREQMKPSEQRINLIADMNGKAIGHLALLPRPKQREKHIADLAISIHSEHHGQGVGSQLMAAALELADNWLNMIRIELQVYSDNDAGIALYKKFDFNIEGEHKYASFSEGRYRHLLTMARLRLPVIPSLALDGGTG